MKPAIRTLIVTAPLAVALCAIGLNVWMRVLIVRADPLAVGHFVGPISGITDDHQTLVVPDSRCHLIRYGSSQCPACRADQQRWKALRDALIAKGCNVTEIAPAANLMEETVSNPHVYRVAEVDPQFIERTRFTATPTMILTNKSWRVVWAREGALSVDDLQEALASQPANLALALFKPVELHKQPSNSVVAAIPPPAKPASLEPTVVDLPVSSSPTDGPASAPVVVVEFADFQCPYCASAARSLRKLHVDFPNDVRLVYKQFPLSIHEFAAQAAGLSVVAESKGQFWQVYDELFRASPELSETVLSKTSESIGLQWGDVEAQLKSPSIQSRIEEDIALGKSVGVLGTPTLFVDGQKYNGPVDLPNLERVVGQEVTRMRNQGIKEPLKISPTRSSGG